MTVDKFVITPEDVEKIRGWYKDRGGVLRWMNLEIGASRPDTITPAIDSEGRNGFIYGRPHWSMGNPRSITPDEIVVSDKTLLEVPGKFLKTCERCSGSRVRSIRELAEVRGEKYEECLEKLRDGSIFLNTGPFDGSAETFPCNYCQGTGYQEAGKIFSGAKRTYYGGLLLTKKGEGKAERISKELRKQTGKPVHYDYAVVECFPRLLVELRFYHETVTPFTL